MPRLAAALARVAAPSLRRRCGNATMGGSVGAEIARLQEDSMVKRACQLLIVCLATGTLWAKSDPFVGTWKLNPSKSRVTDRMKVEAVGANKYAFTFGAGGAETVVADGTDQPGIGGTTLAVSIEGPDSWKVVRKKSGTMMLTAMWKLSADGATLTDSYTSYRPDGSSSTMDYVYKRTAPGSGFPATWESTSMQMNAYELQIQPYQGDGLAFTYPTQQRTRNLRFDGQDYPDAGANALAGTASSGRRVSARTLALTSKMNGKVTGTQEITVSPDLELLTITARPAGEGTPNILVFDRE
jgi:hypothetical protein